MTQSFRWLYPLNESITGTVSLDYACLLAQAYPEGFDVAPIQLPVTGTLKPDATIDLKAGICLEEQSFCLQAEFNGLGEDDDGDGTMDTYVGDLRFYLAIQGLEPYDVTVPFSATADER